jgi:hypothetical protein
MKILSTLTLIFFTAALARADRVGDFDIQAHVQNAETAQVMNRSGSWTAKDKNQRLFYKIRMELKGLKKLEKLEVHYIIYCYSPQAEGELKSGMNTLTDQYDIKELSPFGKVEFDTSGFGKSYLETQDNSGKARYGRAELKGITLRIMQGTEKLAEYSSPPDMKKAWDEIGKKSTRKVNQ